MKTLTPDKPKEATKGLESLFNEEEEPRKEETPSLPPAPQPEVKKEETAPPPAPEPEVKAEPEVEDDLDRPPPGTDARARESAAQVRAAENGRKLKALEAEHQEAKLEMDRLRSELEVTKKSASQQPQNYRPEDFTSHEAVTPLVKQITQDRDAFAKVQDPGIGKIVRAKFGHYMDKFMVADAADPETSVAADQQLRDEIAEDFRQAYKATNGDGYDEDEMNREAKTFVRSMVEVLVRNAGRTQEIQTKISDLAARAREGNLAQGVEVYQHHETDLRKSMEGVMGLPDTAIEDNPHSVEATVATLLRQPEWKKRYDAINSQVLELALGPKALTQAELDGMKNGGIDVREFTKNRQKAFLEKRRKLAAQISQALLLRGMWEQTSRDAAEFNDSKNVLNAISKAKPTAPSPPPPPEKKKASEFVSSIESHLREEGY